MRPFSTTSELMAHQADCVAKLLPAKVGAMFMEMGTGKSRTLLEMARIRQDKFDRLIWLCPVSLKPTCLAEIARHTDLAEDEVYAFDHRTDDAGVPLDRRVYVVGIESLSSSSRAVLAYAKIVTERSFVAIDESSYIKGPRAIRTRRITAMSERARYRLVMTGTPISQGVVDLYSQMRFLDAHILGYRSFHSFANNHLEYEMTRTGTGRKRPTGRILRTHNHAYLASRMAPYAYQVLRSECLTLPDKLHEDRFFEMSDGQWEAYADAKDKFLRDMQERGETSSIPILRLFGCLQLVVAGIGCAHGRLDALASVIADIHSDEKVIVWTRYHHSVREIVGHLRAVHGGSAVEEFHGLVDQRDREAALDRWRRSARFLVATQASGGHGLTLNEAAHAVFYTDGFKLAERLQAEDRNHRIGQERPPVYITLRARGTIDERIASSLRTKRDALASFVRQIQAYQRAEMHAEVAAMVKSL